MSIIEFKKHRYLFKKKTSKAFSITIGIKLFVKKSWITIKYITVDSVYKRLALSLMELQLTRCKPCVVQFIQLTDN